MPKPSPLPKQKRFYPSICNSSKVCIFKILFNCLLKVALEIYLNLVSSVLKHFQLELEC